ncbi:MAG: ATPase [Oscillospiraceae bacterium]|nr:ATPase [Oscillospiraceae bacterium]
MIIDEILDMMDDMLDEANAVPFSNKKGVIDLDKMRSCINDLRLNLPDEIRNAKNIVRDRQEIVSDANKEADQIVRRAEERAKVIVSNDEITKAAKQQAVEILNQAQARAKDIRNAANKYIDDILLQSESVLQTSLTDIKKTRQAVRNVPSSAAVQKPKN